MLLMPGYWGCQSLLPVSWGQVLLHLQGEREEYQPAGIPEPRHASPIVQAAIDGGLKSM